jgi:transcriptional regulator GlxA family with amidase domain
MTMKIAIFIFEGITALDAIGPYESLARIADSEIVFVAKQAGTIRTGDGFLALRADAGIADVHKADVLIIPGGHPRGLKAEISDTSLQSWIKHIDATTNWTCSVCTGSLILAATGLLSERKVSTHWRAQDALARFGAIYSLDRITVDGKYMTSAGVSAGIDMGLALCGELVGRDLAEAIELSMQYDPKPPFGTGDPEQFATSARVQLIENCLRK